MPVVSETVSGTLLNGTFLPDICLEVVHDRAFSKLPFAKMALTVVLFADISGIATGLLEYHFFNDEYDSVHYSASGTVVEYVRNAEMLCTAGDTILTTEAWRYLESKGIHTRYTYTALPEDMVKIKTQEELIFLSEMRHVTIVFVCMPDFIDIDLPTLSALYRIVSAALKETDVIGRKVNLAARLMSKYSDYLMVCDEDTYQRSVLLMGPNNFKELEWRKLKGIEHMGRVFQVKITTEDLLKEYTKGNPAAMVEILQVLKQKGLIHNINSTTVVEARLKREFTLAKEDEHELREHRPGEGYLSQLVQLIGAIIFTQMICDVVGEGLKDDVQVPDSLQALTVVRMEMLNEQEIVLLKKASVCGKAFEVSLLKLLSPTITTAEITGAIKKLVEQHFVTCSANTTTSFVYLLEGKVQDSPECPQCGQVGSLMRFHSAAVHKTIYGTLTYDSKAEIHQDIATCLEENALQCRFCKEYLSVEVYSSATDEFLMQSPPDKADLRVCKCHKTKANAYGQIGNHYYMSGMRGRALEAFLSAAQCSLEVDDVKKAEEYLESSENVFKASSWENVDERYLKLKRIAISRMRATIQLYYGNVDASLQEIKLAFQWLGRNIPKDYRKNASNYALRVVQCCRVDEIEEEEFCLQTAARVFLNRRDPRVALDVSSHFWELVTCRNAPLYKVRRTREMCYSIEMQALNNHDTQRKRLA
ncbi:hypothetical protein V5799_019492 [Amblyomma americanum]|uniref:Uncharacterized protein n=1 Tax=Amblyomma americanum TaxID=6943 RepID=A0AAQ4EX29_AMBAM